MSTKRVLGSFPIVIIEFLCVTGRANQTKSAYDVTEIGVVLYLAPASCRETISDKFTRRSAIYRKQFEIGRRQMKTGTCLRVFKGTALPISSRIDNVLNKSV